MKRRYRQLESELKVEGSKEFKNFTRMRAVAVLNDMNVLGFVAGKQSAEVRNATSLRWKLASNKLKTHLLEV
jgi:hypothetical protein